MSYHVCGECKVAWNSQEPFCWMCGNKAAINATIGSFSTPHVYRAIPPDDESAARWDLDEIAAITDAPHP